MKFDRMLIALAVTLGAAHAAGAEGVRQVSRSIIAIGEPAAPKETSDRDSRAGFVPSVPPAPGKEKPAPKPKVVSNPPSFARADGMAPGPQDPGKVEDDMSPPSGEKTSAIGAGDAVDDEAGESIDLGDMKIRTE